jgi:hypothetical protein
VVFVRSKRVTTNYFANSNRVVHSCPFSRPFSPFLPFSLFFAWFLSPFPIRSTKRVENRKKKKQGPTCNSGGNAKKKGAKKGAKKGYCEHPGPGLPFSTLFRTHFASFSLFHAVWVLLSFLNGHVPPQMFKKDWGDFFWIL